MAIQLRFGARDLTRARDEHRNGIFVSEANEGSSELVSDGSEERNRLGRSVAALLCGVV